MFDLMVEKLRGALAGLTKKGKLTPDDVEQAIKQLRIALIEADVHLSVIKELLGRVKERGLGAQVLESFTPFQQIVTILYEEVLRVLGETGGGLRFGPNPPSILLLVGLNGSGKTTTAGKLALHLKRHGRTPAVVGLDPYRPAALDQLQKVAAIAGVPCFGELNRPLDQVVRKAVEDAKNQAIDTLILDTAGRQQINEELMAELVAIDRQTSPTERLLVLDAMEGVNGLQVARGFQEKVPLTGLVITKTDGDARGGIVLSARFATGVPIRFIGTGEKLEGLEPFAPERMATRILGMGDLQTFAEKAQEAITPEETDRIERRIAEGKLDLEDFLHQMKLMKKMGSLPSLLKYIPGLHIPSDALEEGAAQLPRIEAVILSMTPQERRHPDLIDGRRRRRIAGGSGTSVQEVNQVLRQYEQTKKMLKMMTKMQPKKGRGRA